MATIIIADVVDPEQVESAITRVWDHKGKILAGTSKLNRTEVDLRDAIGLLLPTNDPVPDRTKLYLLPAPKPSKPTLNQQWHDACNKAEEAVETLQNLQADADTWLQKLANKGHGEMRRKLQALLQLDLRTVYTIVLLAGSMDFPKGFGRDKGETQDG